MLHDILPGESSRWQAAERIFLDTLHLGGFREIRFARLDGAEAFPAAVLRSGLPAEWLPCKLCGFFDTPEGRQFCAALFGPPYPAAAAELISLAGDFLALAGLPDLRLETGPCEGAASLAARLDAMNLDARPSSLSPGTFAFLRGETPICAGGRLDSEIPGAWFSIGGEQLLTALAEEGVELPAPDPCVLYIAPADEEAEIAAAAMAAGLRGEGFAAECGLMGLPPAEDLSCAERTGARFTMTLDKNSLAAGRAEIRSTATGETAETGFGEELARFFSNWQIAELTGALEGISLQPDGQE